MWRRCAAALTTNDPTAPAQQPPQPDRRRLHRRRNCRAVADVRAGNDLLVIADEAYEHLWFDDNRHIPIASLPGMWDRTVTIGSGGKSFSFTGWKVGWATGPADLIAAVRVVRQHLSYVSGGPFQYAMAAGLRLPDTYFEQFREGLSRQRDLLCDGLCATWGCE